VTIRLLAVAACAALFPAAAAAADESPGPMPHGAAMAATMMCRPAAQGERANAMMMGATKTELVCKAMPAAAQMMHGPDLSKALTVQQVDAAWRAYVESMMSVTGGGGG